MDGGNSIAAYAVQAAQLARNQGTTQLPYEALTTSVSASAYPVQDQRTSVYNNNNK